MTTKTIEGNVADTILSEPIKLKVNGHEFVIPRPTLGTMIEVSKMVSKYGVKEYDMTPNEMPTEAMRLAREMDGVDEVLAMLILGRKKAYKGGISLFGFEIRRPNYKRYAEWLRDNITPQGMANVLIGVMSGMESGFFLATITSLSKMNLLKPTKQTAQTASGQ